MELLAKMKGQAPGPELPPAALLGRLLRMSRSRAIGLWCSFPRDFCEVSGFAFY